MRRRLAQQGFGANRGFRWQGGEISRLEGLSDAVFAFAVTLLVVSLLVFVLLWVRDRRRRLLGCALARP